MNDIPPAEPPTQIVFTRPAGGLDPVPKMYVSQDGKPYVSEDGLRQYISTP